MQSFSWSGDLCFSEPDHVSPEPGHRGPGWKPLLHCRGGGGAGLLILWRHLHEDYQLHVHPQQHSCPRGWGSRQHTDHMDTVQPVFQSMPTLEGATTFQRLQQLTVCPMGNKSTTQPIKFQIRPQTALIPQPKPQPLPQPALVPQPQATVLPLLQTMQVLQVNPSGAGVSGVSAPQNTNKQSVVILQQGNACSSQAAPMNTADKAGMQGSKSTLQLVQPTTAEEPTTNVALNSLGALSSLNKSISQGLPLTITSLTNLQKPAAPPSVVQQQQQQPTSSVAPAVQEVAPTAPSRHLQASATPPLPLVLMFCG
ncbi:unnamed protein product [Gadus morhua 'NCC']